MTRSDARRVFSSLTSCGQVLVLCALLVSPPQLAHAGTGRAVRSGGVTELDFAVSVGLSPPLSQAEMDFITDAFTGGNEILADATDGNFVFDEICLVTSSTSSVRSHAEVWIHDSGGRANAHVNGFGTPNLHVNLYYDDDIEQSTTREKEGNYYTIAHEFGHLVWGIRDEYSGPGTSNADCEPKPGVPTANYSLMDNYFTRGSQTIGDDYSLNEFCTEVPGNHDPDADTWQQSKNKQSAWETIDEHPTRSAPKPMSSGVAALPDDAPPAVSAPTFITASGILKIGIVADRSGSMSSLAKGVSRLSLAQQGSRLFVDLLQVGESITVASFASSATTDLVLTEIVDDTQRDAAKSAIDAWTATGTTALGSGVIEARDELTSTGTTCVQVLVVLSDGAENVSPFIDSVKQSLIDADISVFSIAIGTGSHTQEMADLADDTQGKFYHVKDASFLPGLLAMIEEESKGNGMIARAPDEDVSQGSTDTHVIGVDSTGSEIAFVLSWVNASDDLSLSFMKPGGGTIVPADSGLTDIRYVTASTHQIAFIGSSELEVGDWDVMVTGDSVSSDGSYALHVFTTDQGSSATASAQRSDSLLIFPEAIEIEVSTNSQFYRTLNLAVTADVEMPNGSTLQVVLLDDGNTLVSGDKRANDGVFTNRLIPPGGIGVYNYEIKVINTSGVAYPGEVLFASDGTGITIPTIQPFERSVLASVVVMRASVPASSPWGWTLIVMLLILSTLFVVRNRAKGLPEGSDK